MTAAAAVSDEPGYLQNGSGVLTLTLGSAVVWGFLAAAAEVFVPGSSLVAKALNAGIGTAIGLLSPIVSTTFALTASSFTRSMAAIAQGRWRERVGDDHLRAVRRDGFRAGLFGATVVPPATVVAGKMLGLC